jgi:signal transduction histidine kinase/CheY-like chemotaxis protein
MVGKIMKTNDKREIRKVLLVLLAVASVMLAFFLFLQDTNKQSASISIKSLKDSATQSALRIDEVLDNGQAAIGLTADLYELMLQNPKVEQEDLKELADESPFNYIEFVDKNGFDLNAAGETFDVSDRNYYIDGMNGGSGIDVILDPRNDTEHLIVFYTPLSYKHETIGVLLGIYKESQMQEILYRTFYGEESRTFLCTRDGSVIASYQEGTSPDTIFAPDNFNGSLSEQVEQELRDAIANGEEYAFQYQGSAGTANSYVTPLSQSDWVLVQTFPSQATNQIIQGANRAGLRLLAELVIIFVVCFLVVQIAASIQRKKLLKTNQEQASVIDGIMQLFGAFVLVDLEQDTYQYMEGSHPRQSDFPMEGSYENFRSFVSALLKNEEDSEKLKIVLGKEEIQKNLDRNTSYLRYEHQIKSDTEKWDSLNLICLERVDGVVSKVLFTYQDVTSVKEQEQRNYEALRDAYRAVESANQAKSTFLSNMSHDIRTPMNAIMGMTAIAAMNIENPDRVKDCLNKITVSSQHLLGLINEVLDMSKIESGKMIFAEEEFSLSDVVDRIVTMFLPQAQEKQQEFKVNIADITHEEVIGDSMRLQQILVNILGNAVKFTQNGGRIIFGISEKPSDIQGCGCYVFTFEDNGIGMDEAFLDKIFEPFVRADNSRNGKLEGTGLGMPIVKNIVQMMNGDIQVESKLNEGSKFTVTIYLKLNHLKRNDVAGLENLAVLVADDEQMSCESACVILKEIGMDADWVLSGDEAIQKLLQAQEEKKDYAAVILDWKMPGKDGIETAREIRSKVGEEVPIIILSAYDYSSIEQEAKAAGINAFISKPLFKSRLIYVMKSLMLGEEEEHTEVDQLQSRNYEGKRVLIAEDNELNMEIAEELLRQVGVEVDTAVNGRMAVERVREMPAAYYDLILMDIQMPEMNGYEATMAIRQTAMREDLQTVPIVAMSADAFTDDVRHAKEVGMNDHLAKPVEIDKLISILDKWI